MIDTAQDTGLGDDDRKGPDSLMPRPDQLRELYQAMGLDLDEIAELPQSLTPASLKQHDSISPFGNRDDYIKHVTWQLEELNQRYHIDGYSSDELPFKDFGINWARPLACLYTCHRIISNDQLTEELKVELLKHVESVLKSKFHPYEEPPFDSVFQNSLLWLGYDAVYLENIFKSSDYHNQEKDLLVAMFSIAINEFITFCENKNSQQDDNSQLFNSLEQAFENMGQECPNVARVALQLLLGRGEQRIDIFDVTNQYFQRDTNPLSSEGMVAESAKTLSEGYSLALELAKAFTPIAKLPAWQNPFGELG